MDATGFYLSHWGDRDQVKVETELGNCMIKTGNNLSTALLLPHLMNYRHFNSTNILAIVSSVTLSQMQNVYGPIHNG